ncbi:hypothetical protein KP509_24G066000 [Ceratopteris richardii]|uniref:Uncharacterized protein n=1 Tax=Ceratopteris richardii TaxID=49495 RepID=A0A8T2RVC4_CERRI|nr:hypothetical protein KP509_24G066000 [Ceratopteris richardii]
MAGDLQPPPSRSEEPKCDFCEERRAFLYCKPDSARLCLLCDHHVHAANPLSLKHVRAPLCEFCGERASAWQCEEEGRFLCAVCEQEGHDGDGHTLAKSSTFTGCLVPSQLASAWKCHTFNALRQDVLLSSRITAFDKFCWASDASLSSILDPPWTSSLDSFLSSDASSCFSDPSISPDQLLGEGQCAGNKVFLEQLEQLRRRQVECDDSLVGWLQEPIQHCLAPSLEQYTVPFMNLDAQLYSEAQMQQEVPVQHGHSLNAYSHPQGFDNKTLWNHSSEKKGARVTTTKDTTKDQNESHTHSPIMKTKQQSWMPPPPPPPFFQNNEMTHNPKNEKHVVSSSRVNSQISQILDGSWPGTVATDCPSSFRSSLREDNDDTISFNDDIPTSKKPFDSEPQNQSEHSLSHSFLNKEQASAPSKCDTAASAKARGSAMLRYKEKKKMRNFDKFVRYESRRARAETRLRVRGRFVKAGNFNVETNCK